MTTTKRQNFNITPEQEAEIARLKELINAPTTKDTILSAVRFYTVVAREIHEGGQVYLTGAKESPMGKLIIPDLEAMKPPRFKYLVRRPHEWRQQLYVKGRRLPAVSVYRDFLIEKRTAEQLAEDWELPVEAVEECIRYCQENQALLKMEADEEKRRLAEKGIKFGS